MNRFLRLPAERLQQNMGSKSQKGTRKYSELELKAEHVKQQLRIFLKAEQASQQQEINKCF